MENVRGRAWTYDFMSYKSLASVGRITHSTNHSTSDEQLHTTYTRTCTRYTSFTTHLVVPNLPSCSIIDDIWYNLQKKNGGEKLGSRCEPHAEIPGYRVYLLLRLSFATSLRFPPHMLPASVPACQPHPQFRGLTLADVDPGGEDPSAKGVDASSANIIAGLAG